ncbi:MAG: RNA polymerase sigma factor [Planctomycetes bacterium]|nr:RNA polymerase sigma factor [Planctomycetota bacterium]
MTKRKDPRRDPLPRRPAGAPAGVPPGQPPLTAEGPAEGDAGARWMLAFQAGDDLGLDRIVDRYLASVLHFIERSVRDLGRAEDLTQDVFLRVYRSRARYRPTAGFRTWLFTIATRLVLNEARARRRRRRVFAEVGTRRGEEGERGREDFWANVPDPSLETPLATVERKELERVLDRLIAELPRNQRIAIELQRTECFSYQEIAGVLRVTTMAVKSLLVRARETLRSGLERYLAAGKEDIRGQEGRWTA